MGILTKCYKLIRDVVVDYEIDPKKCIQCRDKPCIKSCPVEAIYLIEEVANLNERCIGCSLCREACPYNAINVNTQLSPPIKENIPNINRKLCRACGACVVACKTGSIDLVSAGDEIHSEINSNTCVRCGYCFRTCPTDAIKYGELMPQAVTEWNGLFVNQDTCIGCMTCTRVCPSKGSIKIGNVNKLPYIDPSYCARCEECMKICPTTAIRYDKRENVFAEFNKIKSLEIASEIIHKDVETLSNYISRIDLNLPKKLFKTISKEYDEYELKLNVTEVIKNELDLLIGSEFSINEIKNLSEFFLIDRKISVIEKNCIGCGKCIDICLVNSIWLKQPSPICIKDSCIFCGQCVEKCKFDAINLKEEFFINKNQDIFFIRENITDARTGKIEINQDSCQSCGVCSKKCSLKALSIEDDRVLIDYDKCIRCRECEVICPVNAIKLNQYNVPVTLE
ncbi:MAG: 4Fe-4S binding protein [Methanobrevibacter sp.]|jgi:energy-converting hydrogenase A subunit Q|nr:4Fe-4S binding protein [Candidatus Methanovirga basalitermitum]